MLLAIFLTIASSGLATDYVELDTQLTQDEIDEFNTLLTPVMKIYNFIKYVITVVAAVCMMYAGITYMTSGADPKKRDTAKHIATYTVVGLILIWATPYVITMLLA